MRWGPLVLLVAAATQPAASPADPLQAYHEAVTALDRHSDGLGYDGSPEGRVAQEALWTRAAEWTASYLDTHPDATEEQLETAGRNLDIAVQGVRLGRETWAAGFNYGEAGTIFILTRRGGHFREAWRIDSDRSNDKDFPGLVGWSVKAADSRCQGVYREEVGDITCGPLYGGLTRLPRDVAGRARFAVDANYGERAGAAVGSQFTVWSWDGARARPLYLHAYVRPIEGMENRFDGRIFHLEERTEFRTAFVTAPEIGRQLNTALRIAPSGVTQLSHEPASPERDFVDRLLADAIAGAPLDSRAAPSVAARLKSLIAENSLAGSKDWRPLGELMGSSVTPRPAGALVCFATDEFGELHFALTHRKAGWFVASLSEKPVPGEQPCGFSLP